MVCFIEGDGQDLVLAVGSTYDRLLVHGSSQVLDINELISQSKDRKFTLEVDSQLQLLSKHVPIVSKYMV